MIKILITMIFGLVLMSFAQEGAPPKADGKSTNSIEPTQNPSADFSSDIDYSKSAGVGKKPQDQEGKLTDNATKGCTNCKQPTKGRITSKSGAHTKGSKGKSTTVPSKEAESNQ